MPIYLHPYYKKIGYKEGLCPVAENVYKNIYSPKMVTQHLENNIEIEEVFNILDKQIQNIMYNIF
jgi:hypothetical protein